MVYVYKKLVSGKPYYYLRVSKREGKKVVTKDLAYLGSDINNVRKEINNLSKYKSEIRKAYRKINIFLETEYYKNKVISFKLKEDIFLEKQLIELEAIRLHYINNFKKQDLITKKEILNNFIINFSYNTTSIEGNTITLKEAQNLLEEGKTPKDKTLREIYDLQNTQRVFEKLVDSKVKITHKFIEDLHKELMLNIDNRIGYRIKDVKVFRSHFESTPGSYVKSDMDLLLKWYNENLKKLHPFVLAVIFHHKFEKVHPFMDGNGRTGRMLMNVILMNNNYPPMIISRKDRSEYLDCLSSVDDINLIQIDEKYEKLIRFVVSGMTSFYWNIFL
ncbi:MAG: Fic family protein [Candidatus Nanoarchaeia archaeon]|nr:Fic family protein [Candidatus Nanoarchaeia archaeon]